MYSVLQTEAVIYTSLSLSVEGVIGVSVPVTLKHGKLSGENSDECDSSMPGISEREREDM